MIETPLKKYFFLICISALSGCANLHQRSTATVSSFRIVSYNIRELDCVKLSNAEKNIDSEPQVREALNIINMLHPDILSVNEMHYDRYQQPSKKCMTPKGQVGLNVQRMARLLGWNNASTFMGDSNTGQFALKMKNGEFSTDPNLGRPYADPVNFGLYPGQYSVAFLSKFPAQNYFFTRDLVWKSFNPQVDLSPFRYVDKRKKIEGVKGMFNAKTYELFDKNFTDMIVTIDQRPLHVIQLHTVVGGAFGNEMPEEESPNSLRNGEELAFLEWYLTGSTVLNGQNFNAEKIVYINSKGVTKEIYHLPPNTTFIALGDWNIEADMSPSKVGSIVLKRLFTKTQRWYGPTLPTQETWNFNPTTRPGQLDYMLLSQDLEIVKSGGYYPTPQKFDLGCNMSSKPNPSAAGRVVAEYKKFGKTCYIEVNSDYFQAKTASDHFPIWADVKFKN